MSLLNCNLSVSVACADTPQRRIHISFSKEILLPNPKNSSVNYKMRNWKGNRNYTFLFTTATAEQFTAN